MRIEARPAPAILVMGVLSSSEEAQKGGEGRARYIFGPLHSRMVLSSPERFTTYYRAEMGRDLIRAFWVFSNRILRGSLVEAKLATNRIERELSQEGRRTVNLDPGLLTPESLVLATTKPYAHRIYLSKGIYGELTYMFRRGGRIDHLPWTYPDYREPEVMEFFKMARESVFNFHTERI